ncbi:MAG TPA: hypothetical protein VG265_13375 [Gaiellaceae bacterium]|jgi:tartrate dehydratase alpha subunit/fumarate hydratase class I-like protein|nr:hypothetical protein [Gaiellaceae bacterium]
MHKFLVRLQSAAGRIVEVSVLAKSGGSAATKALRELDPAEQFLAISVL